jgi:hypothetical protein
MIPATLKDYILSYSLLWNEEALCNLKVSATTPDRCIVDHLFRENLINTCKKHKGIDLTHDDKWLHPSMDRALFLAPVGTQCLINPASVNLVIAGISTSKQAVVSFYNSFKTQTKKEFPLIAANAIYKGKMLKKLRLFINRLAKDISTDKETLLTLKNIDTWQPDSLEEYPQNGIYKQILATQRIKDASLGYKKTKAKIKCCYGPHQLPLPFEDSDSRSLCYGDLDLLTSFSIPFLDEVETVFSIKGNQKIPLLVLLGKQASLGSKQLTTLSKYFDQIYICNHPSQSQKPDWIKIL